MMSDQPRVLLLESDSESRFLLRSFFEEQAWSVDWAGTPAEAAVMIAARPYELVIFGACGLPDSLVGTLPAPRRPVTVALTPDRRTGADFIVQRGERSQLRGLVAAGRELLACRYSACSGGALRIA